MAQVPGFLRRQGYAGLCYARCAVLHATLHTLLDSALLFGSLLHSTLLCSTLATLVEPSLVYDFVFLHPATVKLTIPYFSKLYTCKLYENLRNYLDLHYFANDAP